MEFKSSKFVVIKSLLITLLGTVVFGIIVYVLTHNELYGMIAILLAILLSLYMSYSEWFFKVVLEDETLKVYHGSKLKQEIALTDAALSSKTKTGGNNIGMDCALTISNSEDTYTIDCTALGAKKYHQLLDALGFDENAVNVLETQGKGERS